MFNTIQDVADFLFGYGHWLEDQGFKFNKFSNELKETLTGQMQSGSSYSGPHRNGHQDQQSQYHRPQMDLN